MASRLFEFIRTQSAVLTRTLQWIVESYACMLVTCTEQGIKPCYNLRGHPVASLFPFSHNDWFANWRSTVLHFPCGHTLLPLGLAVLPSTSAFIVPLHSLGIDRRLLLLDWPSVHPWLRLSCYLFDCLLALHTSTISWDVGPSRCVMDLFLLSINICQLAHEHSSLRSAGTIFLCIFADTG
nr:hypothetical protein CFP56_71454 [Quercus suber]